MTMEASDRLSVEGQKGGWITPDVSGIHPVGVRVRGSEDFLGSILLETKRVGADDETIVQVGLAIELTSDVTVLLPFGWQLRCNLDGLTTGTAAVQMFPYKESGFAAYGPRQAPAQFDAVGAAAITSIGAVITDLEADSGGDSVAQAITDLEAIVATFGG